MLLHDLLVDVRLREISHLIEHVQPRTHGVQGQMQRQEDIGILALIGDEDVVRGALRATNGCADVLAPDARGQPNEPDACAPVNRPSGKVERSLWTD